MPQPTASIARRLYKKYRSAGLIGLANSAFRRVIPYRMQAARLAKQLVQGKSGIEIGGPSFRVFGDRGFLSLYPAIESLDNCNFSFQTLWEGKLDEGQNFFFQPGKPLGWQFVREASDLREIPSGKYDFLLTSHCLEHVANPLKALEEWKRVVADEGVLMIIVPNRDGTFDRRRPITTIEHVVEDYQKGVDESDSTHVEEVVELHDDRDNPPNEPDAFRVHLLRNFEHRQMHHHTFNAPSIARLIDYSGMQILAVESCLPVDTLVIARKLPAGKSPDNALFVGPDAPYRRTSPFASDRA